MRPTGFEPATVGFGVQRSTVGATPSSGVIYCSMFLKCTFLFINNYFFITFLTALSILNDDWNFRLFKNYFYFLIIFIDDSY